MKRQLILLIIILITAKNFAQIDTLYLFVEEPTLRFSCEKSLSFGFAIKSKDAKFITDYYQFDIENIKSFSKNKNYDFDYFTAKELREEIYIQGLDYETIQSLSKNKKWWEIHNELSQKREIYLLEKRKEGFNSQTGNYEYKYYILPMIYEGTRKNIVPTDLSKKP